MRRDFEDIGPDRDGGALWRAPAAALAGLVSVVLAVAVALGLAGPAPAQEGARPPPEVTVVTLRATDVTLTTLLPGRVVASGTAEVRPQVAGIITERLFDEGAEVALDDPLYRIDPASYQAQAAAAAAEVAQAEARLRAARRDFDRVTELYERKVVAEQNYEAALAERDAAEAGLAVARAGQLAAGINLDRTVIRAPLSGTVGRSLTTQGALVTAGQAEPLAVIRKLDPILVDVTQSAAEMLAWRRGRSIAQMSRAEQTVSLLLADGAVYGHAGLLTAAEPHVDEQTGVITLRMQFANPEKLLLPGMYVQVEMPQGVAAGAFLVPQEAVSRDRRGRPVAMVVTDQNLVEERSLSVLRSRGAHWVVSAGLADGDRVIVAGLQKAPPGATVTPEERAPAEDGTTPAADAAPAIR
ncbi:MAG: efflux RND transporter periplasmic adaptor subunit [Alphaproteobacteria bacterium HGW-Alphaproteobacteria-6]|nr:MAG: efflux RND transporter periplasmic adaptor subunit [Alphaproteobacteria bacterium HGW-Alphaproteobacteria-6]